MANRFKFALPVCFLFAVSSPLWVQGQVEPLPTLRVPPIEINPVRIDPLPQIDTRPEPIELPRPIQPLPRPIEPTKLSEPPLSNPQVYRSATAPPGPDRDERESHECAVREFKCAQSCSPLPERWSSYRSCLDFHCDWVEEDCIEKLIKALQDREAAKESRITFKVRCDYKYKVQIEFYSQDRNIAWPGSDKTYVIADYETHEFPLKCHAGEKICYGAWASDGSPYWGSGLNDVHGCTNCCTACDGSVVSYVLKP